MRTRYRRIRLWVAAAWLALPLAAADATLARIAGEQLPSLAALYRELHQSPELSGQEQATAARMAKELAAAGYQVTTGVGGHGVVGLLQNGNGPTLLIRTDLDALPVQENTGRAYASRKPGVMHACGHDLHMTCFIGAARALGQLRDRWKGTLLLIGQPAEEVVTGAARMLADGLYRRFPRPNYCLALHVDAALEAGQIGFREGYVLAAVDAVDITVRGAGGHGAYPHKTKDPVVIAAQLVLALQTIVSREVKPGEPAVVTVGQIHGGTRRNIVPDQVDMELTVRTYSEETRRQVLAAIERITRAVAAAAGLPPGREPVIRIREDGRSPATHNDPALTRRVVAAIREALDANRVVEREPEMASEDFGLFGRVEPAIPSLMFRVGTIDARRWEASQRPGGQPLPSLHSPLYWPDPEPAISAGLQAMTAAALHLLQ